VTPDFYRAFEDRFRGAREVIKSRLRAYLPFVVPLRAARADCSAIDLGCGRGEWLELLGEAGIAARGVDTDEAMLDQARRANLRVEHAEANAALAKLPSDSHDIVSAMHVAEHLPFEDLLTLVREALRVLRPGGLLILETPDPDNLSVGASSFYLDPTHVRPLPAGLLAFLPEHYGFRRVKILRFQELPGLAESDRPSLLNVLRDASADFAVIAQKVGDERQLAGLDPAFERESGVTVEVLARRYDAAIEARLGAAESQAAAAASRVEQLLQSRSWRITAPLRALARLLGRG
jgi:O-antigen chain-terminating methyltransferase